MTDRVRRALLIFRGITLLIVVFVTGTILVDLYLLEAVQLKCGLAKSHLSTTVHNAFSLLVPWLVILAILLVTHRKKASLLDLGRAVAVVGGIICFSLSLPYVSSISAVVIGKRCEKVLFSEDFLIVSREFFHNDSIFLSSIPMLALVILCFLGGLSAFFSWKRKLK